jgi:hypothetical protein
MAAALLQPGLFDRRIDRAASAQASRVTEALARCDARQRWLDRLHQLRAGERMPVFGVLWRG